MLEVDILFAASMAKAATEVPAGFLNLFFSLNPSGSTGVRVIPDFPSLLLLLDGGLGLLASLKGTVALRGSRPAAGLPWALRPDMFAAPNLGPLFSSKLPEIRLAAGPACLVVEVRGRRW